MAKSRARLGFYSRKSAVDAVDGRTREGALMRRVITGLEDELGGADKVTFRQSILIRCAADLVLRHSLAQGRYVCGPDDDREIDRHVTWLVNSLVRTFKALDSEVVRDLGPTLDAYLGATYDKVA